MVHIFVNLPCYLGESEVRIVVVAAPELGRTTLENLTGITEEGKGLPLCMLSDRDHRPLTEYQNADKWHFQEWFQSLWKEERYRKEHSNPYHKEYHYSDSGQEYWYQNDDFRKHFTCCEG